MPIPIIKRSVEEQKKAEKAKKQLSFYTENIENSYKYYLEKVACHAMMSGVKLCTQIKTASELPLGLDEEEYILQLPHRVHYVKKLISKKGDVVAVQDEYIDDDGLYHVIAVNYQTGVYIHVRKGGYALDLGSGAPNLGRKYPEEHYYYDKKNGYVYGGRLKDKEAADKFAAKIDKSIEDLELSLIQHTHQ